MVTAQNENRKKNSCSKKFPYTDVIKSCWLFFEWFSLLFAAHLFIFLFINFDWNLMQTNKNFSTAVLAHQFFFLLFISSSTYHSSLVVLISNRLLFSLSFGFVCRLLKFYKCARKLSKRNLLLLLFGRQWQSFFLHLCLCACFLCLCVNDL